MAATKKIALDRRKVVSRILKHRAAALLVTGLGAPTWDAAAAGDHQIVLDQLRAEEDVRTATATASVSRGGIRSGGADDDGQETARLDVADQYTARPVAPLQVFRQIAEGGAGELVVQLFAGQLFQAGGFDDD